MLCLDYFLLFFFFKQKTAYEMRISDWSSDVCSSDLKNLPRGRIIKDETLADIASHPPRSQEELGKIRGLSAAWKNNDIGARLKNALAEAQPLPQESMLDRGPRTPGLNKESAHLDHLLKMLLKIRVTDTNATST